MSRPTHGGRIRHDRAATLTPRGPLPKLREPVMFTPDETRRLHVAITAADFDEANRIAEAAWARVARARAHADGSATPPAPRRSSAERPRAEREGTDRLRQRLANAWKETT